MAAKNQDPDGLTDGMGPQWRHHKASEMAWDRLAARSHVEVSANGDRIVVSLKTDGADLPRVSYAEVGSAADWLLDRWEDGHTIWMTLDRMTAAKARALVDFRVYGFRDRHWLESENDPAEQVCVIVTANDYVPVDEILGEREVWVAVVNESGKNLGQGYDPRYQFVWMSPRPPTHPPSADRPAAENDYPTVQYSIGMRYHDCQQTAADAEEAARWLHKAAERGLAKAQCALATCYEEGSGVPCDVETACEWYRRAADQGDSRAQFELGARYSSGRGVPQDDAAGADCLRKAAEQGDVFAMAMLAVTYVHGHGVTQDLVEGYRWMYLAIEHGLPIGPDKQAMELGHFEARMTPEQIADAKEAALTFSPKGSADH